MKTQSAHHCNFVRWMPVESDRMFYDRFEYCARLTVDEVSVLRDGIDHAHVDAALDSRNRWRQQVRSRWYPNATPSLTNPIAQSVRQSVHDFAQALQDSTSEYRCVYSADTVYVYSNDPSWLLRLGQLSYVRRQKYTRAMITRPRDVVVLRNSNYRHRCFLRAIRIDYETKETLKNFFTSHPEIRVGPGLRHCLSNKNLKVYFESNYFIDVDDLKWVTLLNLVRPGLIRKTMDIQVVPAK